MLGLGIHKNVPVSDTRLPLGLRVDFVSSHLAGSGVQEFPPRVLGRQPTDRNQTKLRSQRLQRHYGSWSLNPSIPDGCQSDNTQTEKRLAIPCLYGSH